MKFKRILAAGMAVLCSVLPLCPAASAQGDGLVDSGIDYTERVGTVRTPGAGYTSTLAFRCKPGETKAYNPTGDLTLLFVDIGGFSSGSNGTTDSDGNYTPGTDYELDETFFKSMRTTLENCRQNGCMAALRFRYDAGDEALKHEADLPDGTYSFSSALSFTKVLDVSGASGADGANVQLYSTNGTSAQSWRVTHDADGYVILSNVGSGKALDVANGVASSGANVWQYGSNGTDAQRWIAIKNDDGSYTFKSALNGAYVLDISGASTADGANLQLWESNSSAAQRFYATDVSSSSVLDAYAKRNTGVLSDGTYSLATSLDQSKVLDVQWGSKADGANVWLSAKNGSNAQSWRVSHDSEGYVTLTNMGSGKVLDVSGGVAENGRNVQQYASNDTRAQKWIAVKENGGVAFHSALDPSYVLDIAAASTADGTNVQLYQANGSKAQLFKL